MAVPPPRTRARWLNTPSSEMNGWEGDVGEVSKREVTKLPMLVMLGFP